VLKRYDLNNGIKHDRRRELMNNEGSKQNLTQLKMDRIEFLKKASRGMLCLGRTLRLQSIG
jgi:hypothetical protein